jgi:ComF family protein
MDLRSLCVWGEALLRDTHQFSNDVAARCRAEARRAADELLAALWPRTCWLCRAPIAVGARPLGADNGPDACTAHALTSHGLAGNRCARCARHLPHGIPSGERCRVCRARAPRFAAVLAAGEYAAPLSAWVLALKHGGRCDLARPLGRHLAACCSAHARSTRRQSQRSREQGPLLCPVPLHPLRRLERGYDQAWLLARVLGEALQLPVITPLVRLRATAPQGAEGGRATRRSNVAGAFGLARPGLAARLLGRGPLAGRDVWLVDDVFTSGSTADACADVLRRGGARSVTVVVLARAGGHGRSDPRAGASDSGAARPGGRAPPRGGACARPGRGGCRFRADRTGGTFTPHHRVRDTVGRWRRRS